MSISCNCTGNLLYTVYTPFPCPFSVLAIALFICYTFIPTEIKARTEVKQINEDVAYPERDMEAEK